MSTSREESSGPDDRHYTEYFLDAEDNEDEEDDPDYREDDEEVDDDDMENDVFEEDDEFHDAEEGQLEIVIEDETAGNGDEPATTRARSIPLLHLLASDPDQLSPELQLFLRRSGLGRILLQRLGQQAADDDDDDDDVGYFWGPPRRTRARQLDPDRFPKVPSEKGTELMNSGVFGSTERPSPMKSKKRLARRILDRELGIGGFRNQRLNQSMMTQSIIPSTPAEMVINYDSPVYSGQFSDDGNFFFACVKDFKVRMYDTSNPYNWRHYKTVLYPHGSWTLSDASLSPDNKWLAYTSLQTDVCLAPTDPNDTGEPYVLDFASTRRGGHGYRGNFAIWSIRFSGDGRRLVAGTNADRILVYDIESRQVLHSVRGHENDVNAVCFGDKSSPHILYSGSDDTTIKVWDTRSMADGREAGAFLGHIEGLTYIDSKGDGRYILSNGKDQSMKLWDLKMMYTTARFNEINPLASRRYGNFDYRWGHYDDAEWFPHPNDNSLVTFRGGHRVVKTLIRCHFSPPGSTDSRYVYSGSHDGTVYIYNMDATIAKIIKVKESASRPQTARRSSRFDRRSCCVRDASWHPTAPLIAASANVAWDDGGWDDSGGSVTLHSYNEADMDEGEPRMATGYNDKMRMVGGRQYSEPSTEDEDEDEEAAGVFGEMDDDDDDDGDEIGFLAGI